LSVKIVGVLGSASLLPFTVLEAIWKVGSNQGAQTHLGSRPSGFTIGVLLTKWAGTFLFIKDSLK